MHTLDSDGYPTEEVLYQIGTFRGDQIHKEILELVRSLWYYPDFVEVNGNEYIFRTGGWSGNESLIHAMQENWIFWSFCWEMSKRGGLYVFKCKEIVKDGKKVS